MQNRHGSLAPHYASGAVGLTKDGLVTVRDANAILCTKTVRQFSRGTMRIVIVKRFIKEIARANNHPEWRTSA